MLLFDWKHLFLSLSKADFQYSNWKIFTITIHTKETSEIKRNIYQYQHISIHQNALNKSNFEIKWYIRISYQEDSDQNNWPISISIML